ncbi:hypothetical protein N1851_018388 [Merluccius polli]|uniref:Uncharacterized protein n=1 Tax=Merluccius polli TaxID=89951 RepID=A0AA47NYE2_MERPO|nr:hypothetical protein N1851_018388 [Merluccius polli]
MEPKYCKSIKEGLAYALRPTQKALLIHQLRITALVPFPGNFHQLILGDPIGVPRPAGRYNPSSVSWVGPRVSSQLVQNTSNGRCPGGILNRFSNHHWLLSTWRSTSALRSSRIIKLLILLRRVPISTVEGLERKTNTYLRRWLCVLRSFCSIGLYSTGSKLQLPVTSVVKEYKATKTRQAMMLRDSQDARVRQADIESASRALREAEDRLQNANIVGAGANLHHQGKLGQGQPEGEAWHGAEGGPQGGGGKVTCQGCSHEQAGQLDKVGARVRKGTDLAEHLELEGHWIKFLLCSVYDVLPTLSKLHSWGLAESPSCTLCRGPANLEHVLSSCRSCLVDGKFRWRHDQILTQLAAGVEQARKKPKQLSKGPHFNHFLRAGESAAAETRSKGVLATANDWEMRADLRKQLKFRRR